MRTRVKICGITSVEDALLASRAGADAIGLIQVPQARRYITPDLAAEIANCLPPFVTPVLVFADAAPGQILEIAHRTGISTVQLHGHETVATALALHQLQVIKRLEVGLTLKTELEHWALLDRHQLAAVLLEGPGRSSSSPQHTGQYLGGGTGTPTDWESLGSILDQVDRSVLPPLILAGGLNPDNVADIIRRFRPWSVDTSSGVENPAIPLKKDPKRLSAFLKNATA
jgi:phosphoribosylanthranilate isomerase